MEIVDFVNDLARCPPTITAPAKGLCRVAQVEGSQVFNYHHAMIHEALPDELAVADRVTCRAYAEYEAQFPDWAPYLRRGVPMTDLAREAQVLVAKIDGAIAGAVGYVAPHRKKQEVFAPEWAALRFMSVDPDYRQRGVARALAEECVRRARHDRAGALALFTSPAMTTAVALYLKLGFVHERDIAPVLGMPAKLLVLRLAG